MLVRSLAALWIALGCLVTNAAERPQESTPQPGAAVGGSAPAVVPTADATETKPAPAVPASLPTTNTATTDAKPDKVSPNDDFKPSEQISEDMAVAYPVDI